MSLARWSAFSLVAIVATSLWFGVKFGSSPVMKLALFLFGLAIWYGVLTYFKEVFESRKDRSGDGGI